MTEFTHQREARASNARSPDAPENDRPDMPVKTVENPGSPDQSAELTGPGARPAEPSQPACRHLPSHLRLWIFACLGLIADLWTKHWAFSHLSLNPGDPAGVVVENVMAFRRSLNPGALFGLGKGLVPLFIIASILALVFVLYLFSQSTRDRRSLHIALGLVLAGALGNLYDRAFVIADVVHVNIEGRTRHLAGRVVEENPSHLYIVEGMLEDPDPARRQWFPHATPIPRDLNPAINRQGVVRDFIKMEPRIGSYQVWPWVFNLADAWLVIGVGLLLLNFWWDRKAEQVRAGARES